MRVVRLYATIFGLMLAAASCKESTGPHLGPLARVDVVSGDAQTGPTGAALPLPLVVIVRDDAGNPLPDKLVNFVVVSGGGSVFAPAVQTNAEGKAQNQWTLGTTVGQPQKIELRAVDPATGALVVYTSFTATVTPGAVAQLLKVAGDAQSGSIATPLADSLQVRAVDSYGNPVPNAIVTWASADGGTLSPASSTTRADGTTRALWTTGTHVSAAATATVAGAAPAAFTATAAVTAATNAVVTKIGGDGQTVTAGSIIPQPLAIKVALPDGRPIVGVRAGFRMSWNGGGSAWSTLSGEDGVVALSMVIQAPAGSRPVIGAVFGPTETTTIGSTVQFALTVVPGPPASVLILDKNAEGSIGSIGTSWMPGTALWTLSPLSAPQLFPWDVVAARVTDVAGNPTPGVTVTWTAADGAVVRPATRINGTTVPPTSNVTNADGQVLVHFVAAPVAGAKSRLYARVGTGPLVDSAYVIPVDRTGVTLGFSVATVNLAVGADQDVVVRMNGADVDSDFLTWTSSDPAVATVATLGPPGVPARAKVTGHAMGSAILTAAIGAVKGTVKVNVGTVANVCGEAACEPVTAAYISHFTELGCTGIESYYTPYFGYDGIRRSWDGQGVVGTTLRTMTNKSVRNATGTCYDEWPGGNTLSDFVIVYR
jgi:hypothetical protein